MALFPFIAIPYTGLPCVREKSGKNKIFSRSGNCQGILENVREILPFGFVAKFSVGDTFQ